MLKHYIVLFVVAIFTITGCSKDEEATPSTATPVTAVPTDKIRLTVTVPASTKETDKLSLVGNFPLETWDPKKSAKYELTRVSATEYIIEIHLLNLPKFGDLEYKVVKNATATENTDGYRYVEKTVDCKELAANRIIAAPISAGGKAFTIKVDNFRNTGTCGD